MPASPTASSPAASPMLEWLGSARPAASRMGGKAAALDRLARLGFLVPPGVCLTTAAFEAHLHGLATQPSFGRAMAELPDEAARATVAATVRDQPMPEAVCAALGGAVDRLVTAGETSFAVRSSAIGEDGGDASFAGLHDTELGVAADGVESAVGRCWSSLWSPAAIAYRRRRGHALEGAAMAVVIQALVPADASAVVFTRHPVTGRTDQLLVNTLRGLGEPMVSGIATPDEIVVDKATSAVVDYRPGDRGERLLAVDGTVTRAADPASGPVLNERALGELVELSLAVERAFEAAVDIEAARARDRWYLLQARPITTA